MQQYRLIVLPRKLQNASGADLSGTSTGGVALAFFASVILDRQLSAGGSHLKLGMPWWIAEHCLGVLGPKTPDSVTEQRA